jgi:hypothetical protein
MGVALGDPDVAVAQEAELVSLAVGGQRGAPALDVVATRAGVVERSWLPLRRVTASTASQTGGVDVIRERLDPR